MTADHGLLGLLGGGGASVGESGGTVEAVLEHLDLLLNTRQGSVGHLSDYGLPDISEVYQSFPQSIEMLRRAIKNTIEKYEPRLENVQVRTVDPGDVERDAFRATYQVTGYIAAGDGRSKVRFNTTVSDTGKTSVE